MYDPSFRLPERPFYEAWEGSISASPEILEKNSILSFSFLLSFLSLFLPPSLLFLDLSFELELILWSFGL